METLGHIHDIKFQWNRQTLNKKLCGPVSGCDKCHGRKLSYRVMLRAAVLERVVSERMEGPGVIWGKACPARELQWQRQRRGGGNVLAAEARVAGTGVGWGMGKEV